MIYLCNFLIIRFYLLFSCSANEIEDSKRVLPRFPHFVNIVCNPWGGGGAGAALSGGFLNGVALSLVGGVGVGDGG